MTKQAIIKPAESNDNQRKTFANLRKQAEIALAKQSYREAIEIYYSFIENRLSSILYHLGFLSHRREVVFDPKALNGFLYDKLIDKQGKPRKCRDISTKIRVVRSTFNKAKKIQKEKTDNLDDCWMWAKKPLSFDTYLKLLKQLKSWLRARNEIVHAQFYKNYDDLEDAIINTAKEGSEISRKMDNMSKSIRRARKNKE